MSYKSQCLRSKEWNIEVRERCALKQYKSQSASCATMVHDDPVRRNCLTGGPTIHRKTGFWWYTTVAVGSWENTPPKRGREVIIGHNCATDHGGPTPRLVGCPAPRNNINWITNQKSRIIFSINGVYAKTWWPCCIFEPSGSDRLSYWMHNSFYFEKISMLLRKLEYV